MIDFRSTVRMALGLEEGYILDWRRLGCQYVNHRVADLLPCPAREARWQCEVIGPHTRHRWSNHLIVHERLGNGYRCSAIGDGDWFFKPDAPRPTPLHMV
ncbi:hypothetical protein AB0H43_03075 [Hamadaea sp. NPDC050747]|uniref:hypothetical protein n=1 Tax=Hamadaea sp. NPDC050747 TaxID=3155789 RepID=UPI0033ECFBC0